MERYNQFLEKRMKKVCWPYFDPEFDTLVERINGPRVCIDNDCCGKCTVVKVDSVNKQDLLLEVVQLLTDMDLVIYKSYISSGAGWFMDVFHVRDQQGNKLIDQKLINHIKQAIGAKRVLQTSQKVMKTCSSENLVGGEILNEWTVIELTGIDRPGLFSEISAVLTELKCNVVEAHAWSHNPRIACIVHVSDELTAGRIDDPGRLATIEDHLSIVLRADTTTSHDDLSGVATGSPSSDGAVTHTERRLHQLMLAERDFDTPISSPPHKGVDSNEGRKPIVSIDQCHAKGYSVVQVECKDRPKLMFDTVCTLTDMQYVVFHASAVSRGSTASQEYYIRHMNGCALNTESEKQHVVKCLEAALERRVCEGVRLELCAHDRVGLLSDITRLLREYGLAVVRADVVTHGEEAINVFCVQDISGNTVNMEIVDSVRKAMKPLTIEVKNESPRPSSSDRSYFSFGDMLKSQLERLSHNFTSIR